jgi:Domain of unknown function (DUF1876)
MPDQMWRVDVTFTHDGDKTRADAIIDLSGEHFHGFGQAKRAPGDPDVRAIGHELAAARALSELSHQLLHAAADRIEATEGHPVKVHG